jgi:subtilisin family serine protease
MHIAERGQDRRGHVELQERELLVTRRHVELVREILGERVEAAQDTGDGTGLVRLRLSAGEDVTGTLAALREATAAKYGWSPSIGRNRPVDLAIHGQPQDSTGDGDAEPVRALADRPADSSIGSGVTVGVVDSRIWPSGWLYGAVVADPGDIVLRAADLDCDHNGRLDGQAAHGTFTSGLVLRQAPGATVRLDHGLDTAGRGSTSEVVAAAVRLARRKVDVLNLSLGCYTRDGAPPWGFVQMLRKIHPDIVIVAAAGNRSRVGGPEGEYEPTGPFYPAAFDDVVAVAAVEGDVGNGAGPSWRPAEFSNHGPWLDFAAPGVDVCSTFVEFTPRDPAAQHPSFHGWASWSGTSFATAVVSGTIAATMSQHSLSAHDAVEYLRTAPLPRATFGVTSVPVIDQSPWSLAG